MTFAWQTFASLRLFTGFIYVRAYCMPIALLRQNKPFWLPYLGHAQIISPIDPLWTKSLFTHCRIYACPCVNKDFFTKTCLFILSTKYPKIYGNDENLSRIFRIELQATQSNSKSGEDVSRIIEPESLKTLPYYVWVKSRLQHSPPGNPPRHLTFSKIIVQIPPFPGQNAVHTRVHSGDQMPQPRGHFTGT